ncbi:hypothetical protein GL2_37980 [Microbulbifer sp. GL-2]|nr:hypothetical protein GL2_37980 [Microbulbifer sp. GL-2]
MSGFTAVGNPLSVAAHLTVACDAVDLAAEIQAGVTSAGGVVQVVGLDIALGILHPAIEAGISEVDGVSATRFAVVGGIELVEVAVLQVGNGTYCAGGNAVLGVLCGIAVAGFLDGAVVANHKTQALLVVIDIVGDTSFGRLLGTIAIGVRAQVDRFFTQLVIAVVFPFDRIALGVAYQGLVAAAVIFIDGGIAAVVGEAQQVAVGIVTVLGQFAHATLVGGGFHLGDAPGAVESQFGLNTNSAAHCRFRITDLSNRRFAIGQVVAVGGDTAVAVIKFLRHATGIYPASVHFGNTVIPLPIYIRVVKEHQGTVALLN